MLTTLTIHPQPPYDFAKALRFLAGFPATQHEQIIEPNRLRKGIRVDGHTVAVDLQSTGTVEQPGLTLTVHADIALNATQVDAAAQRLRFMLSLDEDLAPFYALIRRDPPFQQTVLPSLYGYHQVKFPSPFENAAWAVLAQRQPMAQARRMKQTLVDRFSQPVTYAGQPLEAFPQPDDLAGVDLSTWVQVVGNERRARYLAAVSAAFATVDEAFLRDAPYAEVKAWLLAITGIGAWSAAFVLTRGLGRMDQALLAEADSAFNQGLLRAAAPVYGALTLAELRQIAAQYGPWQGYWAHYLKAYTGIMAG